MKMLGFSITLCLSLATVSTDAKSLSPAHLADMNQNLILRPKPIPLNAVKLAGVHFITGSKGQNFGSEASNNNFDDSTIETCSRLGFAVNSCASGLFNKSCPYNDKLYDKCCDATYKYAASQCSYPKTLSSDTCGGKHSCLCSASSFPYASCEAPQIKGSSCTDDTGTKYASCSCPSSVAVPYGCQEAYAAPCGSVCKTAYPDNCRNRTSVQIPYGCAAYYSDCPSKCQTAYSDNCRNRDHNDYGYGCQKWWSDCSSKCEIALTRPSCRIGDIFYADNTCVAPESHNSGKKALGIVIYVNPNGIGGQIMAAENYGGSMNWAASCTDISTLPNKTTVDTAVTDFDSCGNTNKITAYGSASQFPAAWKAKEYAPTTATKGKWCLPAAGVLYSANRNYSKIEKALNILNGTYIHSSAMRGKYYWASTEGEYNKGTYRAQGPYGWANPDSRNMYGASKGYSCGASVLGYVKPVLEY